MSKKNHKEIKQIKMFYACACFVLVLWQQLLINPSDV